MVFGWPTERYGGSTERNLRGQECGNLYHFFVLLAALQVCARETYSHQKRLSIEPRERVKRSRCEVFQVK